MDEPEPQVTGTAEGERLLKPGEVALLFRVDSKTVRGWANSGKLSSLRTPTGHRRFREREVRALLTEHRRHHAEEDEQAVELPDLRHGRPTAEADLDYYSILLARFRMSMLCLQGDAVVRLLVLFMIYLDIAILAAMPFGQDHEMELVAHDRT